MKTVHNVSNKTALAEPYLKSNIVPDAKRNQNFTYLYWRTQCHSLWRDLSCSSVLQEAETQMAFAEKGSFSSTFQPLSSRRINPGHHLCFDCWYSSFKQDQDSSRQWCFPTDCRVEKLSLLQQFKTFLKKSQPQNNPGYQQGSRLLKAKDVLSSQASHQSSLRFRFFGSYPLRQVYRRSRDRLQPPQKRSSFLSSFTLLRISLQRFLAWYLKTRKCLHLHWFGRVLKNMFRQTSSVSLSYSPASRLWFLRSQVHRTPRRSKYWLLYCSQDDSSYQEQSMGSSLSPVQERLGSGRVSLSTVSLEETTPFCGDSPTFTRKRLRTTHPLYFKALCLSSFCNQSPFESRKGLVFLQTPSNHRSPYQGTQRELCSWPNPNQQLPCQSGLFFFTPFRLQHRQLVQETLPTTEISECCFRDYSDRVLSIAREISKNRQPQHTQITSRIYLQTNIGTHYSEN